MEMPKARDLHLCRISPSKVYSRSTTRSAALHKNLGHAAGQMASGYGDIVAEMVEHGARTHPKKGPGCRHLHWNFPCLAMRCGLS